MIEEASRRRLLNSIAVVSSAGLAGCSSNITSANQSNSQQQQQEEQPEPVGEIEGYADSPEDCPYIENDMLQMPPYVRALDLFSISKDQAQVQFKTVPNPLGDYEIEVYLTPVSNIDGWYRDVPFGPSDFSGDTDEPWVYHGDSKPQGGLQYRNISEHGEKVGSFVVPAEASGLYSGYVDIPDDLGEEGVNYGPMPDILVDMDGIQGVENARIREDTAGMIIPPGGREFEKHYRSDDFPCGAYFVQPNNVDLVPHKPYVVNIDIEKDIPKNEPFILTFGVNDSNSPADRDKVVSETQEFMRIGENEFVYPSRHIKDQNQAMKSDGISDYRYWRNAQWVNDSEQPYGSEKIYRNIKSESGDSREWTITRISNFSRFSSRVNDSELFGVNSGDLRREYLYGDFSTGKLDAMLQHLWSVNYNIDKSTVEEAKNLDNMPYDKEYYNYTRNPEVQNHPVIQDVASQLRDACDQMGIKNQTAELRVVADFVQYFTHTFEEGRKEFLNGEAPEDWKMSHNHPVATLYYGQGDCVSFTILANTILRTDYFGYETDIAHVSGESTFTGLGRSVGHISMSVPFTDLDVDSIADADNSIDDRDYDPSEDIVLANSVMDEATYLNNGESHLYIELSGELMLGITKYNLAKNLEPY